MTKDIENKKTTIDPLEHEKFSKLAEEWWDPNGKFKTLHKFNPTRIAFIREKIINHFNISADEKKPFKNIKLLDIGCGGGLLCEPLARLGANMTGIDASSAAIAAARTHSKDSELDISYQEISAEDLADTGALFDVVYASEVIEHVADRQLFLASMARLLKPGGVFVLTTINRSLPALAFAKFAMEYIVRIIPKGTHEFDKFVRPSELRKECETAGLIVDKTSGFVPTPTGGFTMAPLTAINYGVSGQHKL